MLGDLDFSMGWVDETLQAFNELLGDSHSAYAQNFPPMNSTLDEGSGELTLEFALAGFKPEELEFTIAGDQLKLVGEVAKAKDDNSKKKILKTGIRCRSFEARYRLPAGKFNTEEVKVSFKNGLLTVKLPPAAKSKPIKIDIE